MSMTLISTATVGAGGAANIVFSSIPQTFTDLYLVISSRSSAADSVGFIRFNGLNANLNSRFMLGVPPSAIASQDGSNIYFSNTRTENDANAFSNAGIYLANYAGSTHKTVTTEGANNTISNGAITMHLVAGLWANTAAITQITLVTASGNNFVQHTSASLYGITRGTGGATIA